MSRSVELFGNDITQYISEIANVNSTIGEPGQMITNDIPSIKGINRNHFWDINSQNSPFFGANITDYPLKITQDGVTTYDGFIKNISLDIASGSASVSLRSTIQTALEHGCIYVSTSKETPATAIQNIADLYGITIDSGSFGASNSVYNTDNVYIAVNLVKPEMTVIDVIQQIADIGGASIYAINNVLYFDVYQLKTTDSIHTFSDDTNQINGVTILSHPMIEYVEKEPINGYSIVTTNGTAIFGNTADQAKTIQAGQESPIQILSLQAGVWIGEKWIEYMSRNQKRIIFDIPSKYAKTVPLGAPITISYSTGNWEDTILDIVSIDNSSNVSGKIVGVSR